MIVQGNGYRFVLNIIGWARNGPNAHRRYSSSVIASIQAFLHRYIARVLENAAGWAGVLSARV